MLRTGALILSLLIVAWWVRGGDPQTLKHDLLEASNSQTEFAPEGAANHGDWGK